MKVNQIIITQDAEKGFILTDLKTMRVMPVSRKLMGEFIKKIYEENNGDYLPLVYVKNRIEHEEDC